MGADRLAREWDERHADTLAATIEPSPSSLMFQELGPAPAISSESSHFFPQGANKENTARLFPARRTRPTLRPDGSITMLALVPNYLFLSVPPLLYRPAVSNLTNLASRNKRIEHLLDASTTTDGILVACANPTNHVFWRADGGWRGI